MVLPFPIRLSVDIKEALLLPALCVPGRPDACFGAERFEGGPRPFRVAIFGG